MQNTNALWKELFLMPGTAREYSFVIDGVRYGSEAEVEHSVSGELYSDFSFGNAASARLSLSVYADDIPRGATIKRYVRLNNEGTVSGWIPKGVFFVNTRDADGDYWAITAVDAMRKADAPFLSETEVGDWPRPMDEVVADIATQLGVRIDNRTNINPEYLLQYPTDLTMRDVLRHIGAAHGANWIVTDSGDLLMIPLVSTIADADRHNVGLDVVSFEDSGRYKPVSRVTLFVDDENCYTAGDDTGIELTAECASATQDMADAILAQVYGYEYQAYSAGAANIDPAFELGDGVTVGGVDSVLASIEDDGEGYPDISAPGEAEIDEEFPVASPMQKEFNRKLAATRSEIKKMAEGIELSVTNGDTSSIIKIYLNGVEISSQEITFDGYVTVRGLENGETVIDGGCIKADSKIESPQIIGGKFCAGSVEDPDGYVVMTNTGLEVFNGEGLRKIRLGYTSAGHDFPFVELGSGTDETTKGLIKKFTDGLWIGNSAAAEATGLFAPTADYNGMFFAFSTGKAYVVQGTDMQNIYTGESVAKFG